MWKGIEDEQKRAEASGVTESLERSRGLGRRRISVVLLARPREVSAEGRHMNALRGVDIRAQARSGL